MAQELLNSQEAELRSNAVILSVSREKHWGYHAEQDRIRQAHRHWLEWEYGTTTLSQVSRDAIYNQAWEEGHRSGFSSVESEYQDILNIVNVVLANR